LALRVERLVPRNTLEGTGAAAVAREAGLEDGGAVSRQTLALAWRWQPQLAVSLEAGREQAASTPGHRFAALRLVWRDAALLGGAW
jgi:hypothetical protein